MSVLVISESENEGEQLLENQLLDNQLLENQVQENDAVTEGDAPTEGTIDLSAAFAEVEQPVETTRPVDERANVPVTVVTERFLRAILDKVPLDRIEELHLFSPLRQGTVETGIAVVAARVNVIEPVSVPAPLELKLEGNSGVEVDEIMATENGASEIIADEIDIDAELALVANDSDALDEAVAEGSAEAGVEDATAVVEALEAERDVDVETSVEAERAEYDDDSPYADELPVEANRSPTEPEVVAVAPLIVEAEQTPEPPRVRHTVYTARYRLIIKGPERGRWEIDVVDEADAPLLTVETVVRGVQRRAGEETATVRYDAAQVARALRLPIPATT